MQTNPYDRFVNDDGTSCRVYYMDLGCPEPVIEQVFEPARDIELGLLASLSALEIDRHAKRGDTDLKWFENLKKLLQRNMVIPEHASNIRIRFVDPNIESLTRALEATLGTKFSESGYESIKKAFPRGIFLSDKGEEDFTIELRQMYELMANFSLLSREGKEYIGNFCLNLSRAFAGTKSVPAWANFP